MMPLVKCPKCNAWIVVEAEVLSQLMECRYCNSVFPAIPLAEAEATEPTGIAGFFTENYNPEDPAERAAVIAEAQRRVAVPGAGLIVSGFIGIFASVVIAIAVTINHLDKFRPEIYIYFFNLGLCIAAGFLHFLVAAGGRALRRLENRPLCSFAASIGIVGMACCGIYGFVTVLGFLFGTWAFTALSSREVRWKQIERDNRREV
jgi:hypothetical protein